MCELALASALEVEAALRLPEVEADLLLPGLVAPLDLGVRGNR